MEILRLKANTPEVCALKYTDGLPVTSEKSGDDQVLFSLVDGRRLYEDPALQEAITRMGVRKGQPIQITKRGKERFDVAFVKGETETRPSANSTALTTTTHQQIHQQDRQTHHNAGASIPPPPFDWEDVPASDPEIFHQTAPRGTVSSLMMAAYCQAIDCAVESTAYATRKGLPISFTGEDIRCMAATIFINANGGKR